MSNRPFTAREKFLTKRYEYQQKQPFTNPQKKKYTIQQQNFIRSIQIARDIDKNEAIKLFKKSLKSEELSKGLSDEIAKNYEIGIVYREPPTSGIGGIITPPKKEEKAKTPKKQKAKKPKAKTQKAKKPKAKKPVGKQKAKKGYEYAGINKRATEAQKARFVIVDKKKMRYVDTVSGEQISRRERDKRLSLMVEK